MAPRTRRASKKDNRLEVKQLQKRREQVKIAMRRHRQKLTEQQLEDHGKENEELTERQLEDHGKENVITVEDLLAKSLTPAFKGTLSVHQVTWNKDSPGLLHARKLSCIECRPDQICSHYEMVVINTEYSQLSTDRSHVLAIPPSHHQSDQEISEEPGPSGVFTHTDNESTARCVDTDDEDLVTVSIPTKRSRKFYFKSINGSSSKENSNEEIKKKQLIDQVFSEPSDFTKTSRFNIFASDSSDDDLF